MNGMFDEEFERSFAGEMSGFRGTEQEITVMKTVAYRWYRCGQLSILDNARDLVLQGVKGIDEFRTSLARNGIPVRPPATLRRDPSNGR